MGVVKVEFKRPAKWKYIEPIVPALTALPQWYKDKKAHMVGYPPFQQHASGTFKACPVIFDSMTQGYILPLWADLYVEPTQNPENGEIMPSFFWGKGIEDGPLMTMFNVEMTEGMPNVDKTNLPPFKLNSPWILKTSKGYSTLFIAPLNNRDIMFEAISGVIHTDVFTTFIDIPFIWTGPSDFKGIIKQGTPMLQLIPFKREKFQHEIGFITPEDEEEQRACNIFTMAAFSGGYRRLVNKLMGSR